MWRARPEGRDSERRVTMAATQLPHFPSPAPAAANSTSSPHARTKKQKENKKKRRVGARCHTSQSPLSLPPSYPLSSAPPAPPRRHCPAAVLPPPPPSSSSPGSRQLAAMALQAPASSLARGSPCGSRPSRPTSAATAGERAASCPRALSWRYQPAA